MKAKDYEVGLDRLDESADYPLLETESKAFGKDLGLVFFSFGDGKHTKSQQVSLSGKRILDFFYETSFDRHDKTLTKRESLQPRPFTVSELMQIGGLRRPEDLAAVLEAFNGLPVRTDITGQRAKRRARRLLTEIPPSKMTEEKRRTFMQAKSIEIGSSLLTYHRVSSQETDQDFMSGKDRPQSSWSTEDVVVITWGEAVKELIEEPTNVYALISRTEKSLIRSKHGFSLYDILHAEIFRQRGVHHLGSEKLYSQTFDLETAHAMLATDMNEAGYWRTHPYFDKSLPEFQKAPTKEGGLRYFKKEVLNPACQSICRDTMLNVSYVIDRGRKKNKKIFFIIEQKTDERTIDSSVPELELRMGALPGINEMEARTLCSLAPTQIIDRAIIEFEAEAQLKEAKGERILRPRPYMAKIIKRLISEFKADQASQQGALFEPEKSPFASKSEEKACQVFSKSKVAAKHGLSMEPIEVKNYWLRYEQQKQPGVSIEQFLQTAFYGEEFCQWIKTQTV